MCHTPLQLQLSLPLLTSVNLWGIFLRRIRFKLLSFVSQMGDKQQGSRRLLFGAPQSLPSVPSGAPGWWGTGSLFRLSSWSSGSMQTPAPLLGLNCFLFRNTLQEYYLYWDMNFFFFTHTCFFLSCLFSLCHPFQHFIPPFSSTETLFRCLICLWKPVVPEQFFKESCLGGLWLPLMRCPVYSSCFSFLSWFAF